MNGAATTALDGAGAGAALGVAAAPEGVAAEPPAAVASAGAPEAVVEPAGPVCMPSREGLGDTRADRGQCSPTQAAGLLLVSERNCASMHHYAGIDAGSHDLPCMVNTAWRLQSYVRPLCAIQLCLRLLSAMETLRTEGAADVGAMADGIGASACDITSAVSSSRQAQALGITFARL